MGTYHRCWSFDLQIFHDKDKEKITHLNNHHTVKIDVIPNTKATFSSSQVILSNLMLGVTSCLCYLLDSMLGLVSCLCSLLEPVLGLISCFCPLLDLTSGLSFSPSTLIFKLVPILKLGDDISILLL